MEIIWIEEKSVYAIIKMLIRGQIIDAILS